MSSRTLHIVRALVRSATLLCALLVMGTAVQVRAQQPDSVQRPRLDNAGEVARALEEMYPAVLRYRGVGGTARVRMFIGPDGSADTVYIVTSTGLFGLDRAARTTARRARFSFEGDARLGWVELPIQFQGTPDGIGARAVPLFLRNREQVRLARDSFYPAELRAPAIGASVGIALTVDSTGSVVAQALAAPSGFEAANEAALALTARMSFEPATAGDPVRRETFTSVAFGRDSISFVMQGDTVGMDTVPRAPRDAARAGSVSTQKAAQRTGETRSPRLRNRGAVQTALRRQYPPALRDLGLGGTVAVHLWVDEDGLVRHRIVNEPSGSCDLDFAAINVAAVMEFDPALDDGEPVAVWVAIPIHFSAR